MLFTLQGANWQRGGGKGDKPKRLERPNDSAPQIDSSVPIADRKAAQEDEIARRRAIRDQRGAARGRKSKLIERVG
ncbi:hypothetical protein B5566_02440 [Mycobacterium sp. MHSD3]|nr:hypothetical protein B5566_02440 [Mycobacterium sp. MHSD3]